MLFLGRARVLVRVFLSCDLAVIGTAVDCFLFHLGPLRLAYSRWQMVNVALRALVL